jgi:hypothetical protein
MPLHNRRLKDTRIDTLPYRVVHHTKRHGDVSDGRGARGVHGHRRRTLLYAVSGNSKNCLDDMDG